jgi:hypothetical protein
MRNSIFFVLKLIFMGFLFFKHVIGYCGPQLLIREVNTNQGRLTSAVDSREEGGRNVIKYGDFGLVK